MAKTRTVFYCQNCGYESSKWMGQCPGCRQWNTFVEETETVNKKSTSGAAKDKVVQPRTVSEIDLLEEPRMSTGMGEFDRVLGGGIVQGSIILLCGDPGIGKSTLLLQICRNMSGEGRKILYVSGEESLHQLRMRAERIGSFSDNLKILCVTDLSDIREVISREKPQVAVIDSIQTMNDAEISSAPGSISQVRGITGVLMQIAKEMNIAVFVVGHVTKEGVAAGPRVLEHMVDTVLYCEGDRFASYRVLRSEKNRFGSTNEIGVFEMKNEGMQEVPNPSEYMLDGRPEGTSGSVVACTVEGTRPVLLEVQALVCRTNLAFPRRTAAGTDMNRVNILMAVLEKRAGLKLSECDAYINIAGGIRMNEPALDLGIVLAIASSLMDRPVDEKTIAFGEVGLSGEVRSVSMAEQRVREAARLGFTTVILPEVCRKQIRCLENIKLVGVKSVNEAIRTFSTH